jgi:hypothetical protein
MADVVGYRRADVGRDRELVQGAALAADRQNALPPVDVAEPDAGHLGRAQSQPRQEHEDGVVAASACAAAVAGGQDGRDFPAGHPVRLADRLPSGDRRDRGVQRPGDVAGHMQEAQQAAQRGHHRLGVGVTAGPRPAGHEPGDVGGRQRVQRLVERFPGYRDGIEEHGGACGEPADRARRGAALVGQVDPVLGQQPVSRPGQRLHHRADDPTFPEEAGQACQRHAGDPRPVPAGPPLREEAVDLGGGLQRRHVQALLLQPAAQVRHHAHLIADRAARVAPVDQRRPEAGGVTGQRAAHHCWRPLPSQFVF